jgi:hypothetical protein
MIPYVENTLITSNNTYTLDAPFTGSDYVMYVSGTFGSCTATVGYVDGSDVFAPFRDSSGTILTMTSSSLHFVVSPLSKKLAVQITGSTGTTSVKFQLTHRKG